jgi:hypothetical protein
MRAGSVTGAAAEMPAPRPKNAVPRVAASAVVDAIFFNEAMAILRNKQKIKMQYAI